MPSPFSALPEASIISNPALYPKVSQFEQSILYMVEHLIKNLMLLKKMIFNEMFYAFLF